MRLDFVGTMRESRRIACLTWQDGRMEGDARLDFEIEAYRLGHSSIGPMYAPWTVSAEEHLKDPRSVNAIAHRLFEKGFVVDADPPLET